MEPSAIALLRRCARSNDAGSWQTFERFFKPRLMSGITRALWRSHQACDPDLIEELLQEIYCRLLARDRHVLKAFNGTSSGEACAYLIRISESVTLDRLRSRAASKRGADYRLVHGRTGETLSHQLHDPSPSPETVTVGRDIWDRFWAHCALVSGSRSPERDLDILQLALFQGWTSREIAAAKQLRISTVDTVVHRLRRRLARRGLPLPARPGAAREVAEAADDSGDWKP